MFDVTQETKIENYPITPEAATKEPPIRIEVGKKVCWMRPSNVLRVEFRAAVPGWPTNIVVIIFSDGKEMVYSDATADVADTIAALLWPTDGSEK